jgi:predicted anti-sigma-YlaC factor YlaD
VLNCDEVVELVTAYLEGQLESETERRFVTHLAECDGCDRYLDQIRTTVRMLGKPTPENLSDDARDRLLSVFREWHGR